MAHLSCPNISIRGIATCVPEKVDRIADHADAFKNTSIKRIIELSGVKQRHLTNEHTCSSDLCEASARLLLAKLDWKPDCIDLLVFATQTPDFIMPATACAVQSRLGLSDTCAAFDINQGCSGYPYGLSVAASMMGTGSIKRALVLVGETPSKVCYEKDRSTSLIFGDAGSATALEYEQGAEGMQFILQTDGSGVEDFYVDSGGCRKRFSKNERDYYITMNGPGIFSFTMKRVPALVNDSLALANKDLDSIDYYIFHQANLYIMEHLRKRIGIPKGKTPVIIERFGNTGGTSVPLTITNGKLEWTSGRDLDLCLLGYGVGLSWGSVHMKLAQEAILLHSEAAVDK